MKSIGILMKDRWPPRLPWRIAFSTALCIALGLALGRLPAQAQVTSLWTFNWSQTPQPGGQTNDGTGDMYGYVLASLGGGRFAVGSPFVDQFRFGITFADAGAVAYGDQTGVFAPEFCPCGFRADKNFGSALAAFPDGSHIIGFSGYDVLTSTNNNNVGAVYLANSAGSLVRFWQNPTPVPAAANTFFGRTVATLPGNRFAVSSEEGFGRVFM